MKTIKLLFLDIDGVLNSSEYSNWYFNTEKGQQYMYMGGSPDICKNIVDMIVNICKTYSIFIILTSSWRESTLKETKKKLKEYKELNELLPYIVGITPSFYNKNRGYEIEYILYYINNSIIQEQYLDTNIFNNITNIKYCIVDDEYDFNDNQKNYIVKTDYNKGLSKENISNILKILK